MYEEITDEILGISEDKPKDYWVIKGEIPLFTTKVSMDYDGQIPEKDIITLKIDTRDSQSRNPFNAMVCASTGIGKTRLIKNIIKGFWKSGYKILYIEPKGYEMLNAKKKGIGRNLPPLDKNEKLPISLYMPNFIKSHVERNYPLLRNKATFYSPDISKLNYPEIWESFGIPTKASNIIVANINKNKIGITDFEKDILSKGLMSNTKGAAISALEGMKGVGFFGSKDNLNLEKEWDENNIVLVEYLSRDGAFMNTDIGLILDKVRDYSIRESSKGLKNVSKKLIVFDDAFYYAGRSASFATKEGVNLAIRNISNSQNNFRTWGVDTLIVLQSPDSNAISPLLIDGCTTKFVSYIENTQALRDKIPREAFDLITNTDPEFPSLYVDEQNYIYQWIYVKGKTLWTTGFPFDCTVGHS